jgi:hypothetical protein
MRGQRVKGYRWLLGAFALTLVTSAAQAEDERDLCSDSPGKATPSCTIDAGRFRIEGNLLDYAHSRDADSVEDDVSTANLLVAYGVNSSMEARIGWDGYGWTRTRDRMNGMVEHAHGGGDLTLSLRQNLRHPDDKGTAFALQPSLTLPVGGHALGAGTWGAGLIAPFGADLAKDWRLTLDPEVDAAPDEDRHGRHLAYALAAAVSRSIGDAWQLGTEGWVMRDDDPSGHATQASVDFTAAWQPNKDRMIDLSAYVGATHATPRLELVLGVTERF